MKTGHRRPRGTGNLQGWARRQVQDDAQRAKVAQAIAWGPLPAEGRPEWLRLGAWVAVRLPISEIPGQVLNDCGACEYVQELGIVSIRPNGRGGWELLGHLTCNRWYDAGEVTPL